MADDNPTLLDACTVINLDASRHAADILAHGGPHAVSDVVRNESLYIRRGGGGDDARDVVRTDLAALVTRQLLTVITTTDESELSLFIDLAQELDDGEAMTAAIAIHRRLPVVTDDKKAIRVLTTAGVTVTSSLHVVKRWFDADEIDPSMVSRVLTDIRERGSYLPHRGHPLHAWWSGAI